jgi:hypothetical protein
MNYPGNGEHTIADVLEAERFSKEALQPVYQLNRALIELLVASASLPASDAQPQIVVSLGPSLLDLGATAREQLAHCPIALVDFGFRNHEFWLEIESGQTILPSLPACFPRSQAIQLAQNTLTLAWTLWHSNHDAATIIFGFAPDCAAILARVGVQAITRIAELAAHCLRPRWETDTTFWRQLIRVAQTMESSAQPRLPTAGLYAMQRQLADLIVLSPSPATRGTASTRANHR